VRDVMTPGIHCCREDDDLAKAAKHMEGLNVRRLPVINKSKRLVGILSLGDVSHSASVMCWPNASRASRPITTDATERLHFRRNGRRGAGGASHRPQPMTRRPSARRVDRGARTIQAGIGRLYSAMYCSASSSENE
jgi:hypothetical protein